MKASTNTLGHYLIKSLLNCMVYGCGIGVGLALGLMSVVVMSNTAHASIEDEIPLEHVQSLSELQSGQLVFKSDQGHYLMSPSVDTDVDIAITGLLARVTVSQTFSNPTANWQEGIYVFPLPETAAVDHLRMKIGERIVEGDIKEKKEARKIYSEAKAAGKKASLVEQQRPNLFTTSVANIAPNDNITIVIEYQQRVAQDSGEFSLRFPMAITPRYIPGNAIINTQEISHFEGNGWAVNTDQVPDASHITPPVLPNNKVKQSARITVLLAAGFSVNNVMSRYHEIDDVQLDKNTRQIRLVNPAPTERDFELVWHAVAQQAPQAALFKQRKNEQDYALLMLTPPKAMNMNSIAREMVFVVDTSGSMDGTSMEQAKSALQFGLSQLRAKDSFNIIRFSDDLEQLFESSRLANRANIDIATDFVNWLHADGGTEMAPALRRALNDQNENKGLRQVIFLTDGSIGNEDELFSIIENNLDNSRLFTIGIGSAPNSHFMNRAARFGRGSHSYIGSTAEVRQKMQALFSKLSHPVLSDLKVTMGDHSDVELSPKALPDLYLGEPLLLSLKASSLPNEITISGLFGTEQWQKTVTLQGGGQSEAVSILWARRKIEGLMDDYRRDNNDRSKQQIIDVALEHHLVSKFTSLVAVDKTPVRPKEEQLDTRMLAVNPPAGSSMTQFPQTATPASFQLLLGLLLLLASLFLRRRQV